MSNPLDKYLSEKTAVSKELLSKTVQESKATPERLSAFAKNVLGKGEKGKHVAGEAAKKAVTDSLLKGSRFEKKAGLADILGRAKEPAFNAAVGAATMGGLTAGAAGVSFGAKKLYEAITKRRDFRTMLEHNPDLHEHLERDPKFFNQAYSSLRSVNPQFAGEPLIAGNYMRQMMESPMTAGGKVELALQGASHHGSPVLDSTMRGMLQGAASGLGKQVDPHAEMENSIRGLSLQKRRQELMAPPQADPHADLEQQVRGLKLQRDMDRLQEHFQKKQP